MYITFFVFVFQAEDGIRDIGVTGVQTCALPIHLCLARRAFGSGGQRALLGRHTRGVDELLEAPRREDEQEPRRTRLYGEAVGDVFGAEHERTRPGLYGLLPDLEGQLPLEDPETLVLAVVHVERSLALRFEHLDEGVVPAGLLLGSLYGGQAAEPPPRLAFVASYREGPALGIPCRVEDGPPRGLVFCGRHGVTLLSIHNTVQGILTGYGPSVKVKCTKLCNNFSHAAQIRDEAQGRTHGGDPPEDHRGGRRAARDRRSGADHGERHSREGRGAEAHLLRTLPRTKGPLPSLHGPPPGLESPTRALLLVRRRRRRRAPSGRPIGGLRLLLSRGSDVVQRAAGHAAGSRRPRGHGALLPLLGDGEGYHRRRVRGERRAARGAARRFSLGPRLPDVAHTGAPAGAEPRSGSGVDGRDGALPDALLAACSQLPRTPSRRSSPNSTSTRLGK